MEPKQIRMWVRRLDTTSSSVEEAAWLKLRSLGARVVPYLAEFYPQARTWQGRVSLVFHAIRYGRVSESAVQLAIRALGDRSTRVRYRACGLLAYSLRRDALPYLAQLLSHKEKAIVADARAAMDAIEQQNHHYFVDREHTGRSLWVVNVEDRAA